MRAAARSMVLRQFLTLPSATTFGLRCSSSNVRKPAKLEFSVKFNPFGKPETRKPSAAAVPAAATTKKRPQPGATRRGETPAAREVPMVNVEEPQDDDIRPMPASILHEAYIPPFVKGMKTRQLFASNIHVSASTARFNVNSVEFIKSSTSVSQCPQDGYPEFAMIGRSNVGKSSLVNLLVNKKNMALVSKKPGKTRLINHFLINKSWYLVDLPGYGYAKASKVDCMNWNEFTKVYFKKRQTLAMVVLLVDSSSEAKDVDVDCAAWLIQNNVPMTLAFTKCDKSGSKGAVKNVMAFLAKLKEAHPYTPAWVMTSCVTGQGRTELMLYMSEMRKYWHS